MMESAIYIDKNRYWRNYLMLSLFSIPVLYLGIILSVSIHEIIGHGLTTLSLGGRFKGFGIALDGMGWADIDVDSLSSFGKALVLFSGAFYTTVFSLLFFALGLVFKKKPFASLTFLFFAMTSLLDGSPYIFWDAIRLAGIGDFSGIWFFYPDVKLRILAIFLFGFLMVFGIVFFTARYYALGSRLLGEGKPIPFTGKAAYSLAVFILQLLGWFSFDWNQLVPGVGLLPGILASGIALATLVVVTSSHRVDAGAPWRGKARFTAPIYAAWISGLAAVLVIVFWLQNGASFA